MKTYWLYILAAIITIIGLVTGWYFFLLLVIPFGLFRTRKKNHEE
ncbi:MAG: hypothetical protein WBL27_06065 [Salinimicrobium sp.]